MQPVNVKSCMQMEMSECVRYDCLVLQDVESIFSVLYNNWAVFVQTQRGESL